MTVREVSNAVREIMRDLHVNRIEVPKTKLIVSAYGPVLAIKKVEHGALPFELLIQDGPDEFFWQQLDYMPDWKEVLVKVYKAIIPKNVTKK